MRRSGLCALVALGATGAAIVSAAAAGADESTMIYVSETGGLCFTTQPGNPPCGAKPELRIETGDTVTWDFSDGTQQHNVQDGDRPLGDPAWKSQFPTTAPYSRTFGTAGTYRFVCLAHPTMDGTITVVGEPVETPTPTPTATATPTPTATATPFPTPTRDDHTVTPAPGHAGIKDDVAPRLARASVKRTGGGLRVRFWVSEPAKVEITVRRGRAKVVSATVQAPAGTRAATLRAPRAKAGTYTVELRATDAMGNRAAAFSRRVKLR